MKVALVHDYLTQYGGAERVVLSLHRMFPDAPLHTTVYDPGGTYPEYRDLDVRTSFLQALPHRGAAVRYLLPMYPAAIESMSLKGYDLVVSSTSGWAHGVRTPDTPHVTFCHNPPRWLIDTDRYLGESGMVPRWAAPALRPVLAGLRRWDRRAAKRPAHYVAISEVVAERIRRHYGREATIVHTPVEFERIAATVKARRAEGVVDDPVDPYHLVVARHLPYKRIDLAIRACAEIGHRLVIVGGRGPATAQLSEIADETVTMIPLVAESDLVGLLHGATSVIQAGIEDFGLGPLEANSAGTPSVAFAAGGALETVDDGVSGVLFPEQSVGSLVEALRTVSERRWDPADLEAHARSFDEAHFRNRLQRVIDDVLAGRIEAGR